MQADNPPTWPLSGQKSEGRVVFVALGSRGDVQPLAIIANRLAELESEQVLVSFVTHFELADLVQNIAPTVSTCAAHKGRPCPAPRL
jgi:hypothetical protein